MFRFTEVGGFEVDARARAKLEADDAMTASLAVKNGDENNAGGSGEGVKGKTNKKSFHLEKVDSKGKLDSLSQQQKDKHEQLDEKSPA